MEKNTENTPKETSSTSNGFVSFLGWILFFAVLIAVGGAGWFGYGQMVKIQQKIADLEQNAQSANKLYNKQNMFEQRLTALENSASETYVAAPSDNSAEMAEIRGQFNEWLEQKENALSSALQKLENVKVSDKPQSADVLLAAGALTVQNMAQTGLPFEYEAEVLQILAQGNPQAQKYATTVQKFAHGGVVSAKSLVEDFNNIYAVLNNMPVADAPAQPQAEEPTPQKWYEKAWQWFKKLAVHRKKMPKPEFKAEQDQIYALVNEARFAEALNKMETDVKYNSVEAPMLRAWQNQAESYVEFEAAMNALLMNAMANVRLKEMQK